MPFHPGKGLSTKETDAGELNLLSPPFSPLARIAPHPLFLPSPIFIDFYGGFPLKESDSHPIVSEKSKVSLKSWLIAKLIRLCLHFLGWTWTVRWVEGEERFRKNCGAHQPLILCTWHNRMFFYGWFLEKVYKNHDWSFAVMSSRSRDGDIGAELARMGGGKAARGSSGQGGASSLKQLIRFIRNERTSVILLNDASRGPIYQAKKGAVILSKITGAPLVPTMWSTSNEWVFHKAWDKFKIPKPFATIYLFYGDPITIPRRQSEEEDEQQRLRLERRLNHIRRRCDAEAGVVSDPAD